MVFNTVYIAINKVPYPGQVVARYIVVAYYEGRAQLACSTFLRGAGHRPARRPPSMRERHAEMGDRLARGAWLTVNHSSVYGSVFGQTRWTKLGKNPQQWVHFFHGHGPLAYWCERYPGGSASRSRDAFQFGVYTGGSMKAIVRYFGLLNLQFGVLWGFDSFEGLPLENQDELPKFTKSAWKPGSYSSADALNLHSYSELATALTRIIGRRDGPVSFVRGWYNASLTPTLAQDRGMQPALYVDIDVDLYSSAIACLDWLFCSGLMEAGSTVVRYDDWVGSSEHLTGEKRAHYEITQRHHIMWEQPFLAKREWFLLVAYRLDEAHCASHGYARVPQWLRSPREMLSLPPPPPPTLMAPTRPAPPPPIHRHIRPRKSTSKFNSNRISLTTTGLLQDCHIRLSVGRAGRHGWRGLRDDCKRVQEGLVSRQDWALSPVGVQASTPKVLSVCGWRHDNRTQVGIGGPHAPIPA